MPPFRTTFLSEAAAGRAQVFRWRFFLLGAFFEAGADLACTAAFYLGRVGSPVRSMSTPALCLSRFAMDALLAGQMRQAGGFLVGRLGFGAYEDEQTAGGGLFPALMY